MPRPSSVFGSFPGSAMDMLEAEKGAIQLVNDALLRQEPALFKDKWFDYRRLHPSVATSLFAEAYRRAYTRAWVKHFDHRDVNKTGLRVQTLFKMPKGEVTGLWKARQAADRLGVAYDEFCKSAIEHGLENYYKQPPRPSQLYGDETLKVVAENWDAKVGAILTVPVDPWYRLENDIGHSYQHEFRRWLVKQIQRRRNPAYALAQVVWREPMISEADVRAEFPAETVDRAREIWADEISKP